MGSEGGKPIQSSEIRAAVAAEAARRPCQPGSFRAKERKKKKRPLNGKREEGESQESE